MARDLAVSGDDGRPVAAEKAVTRLDKYEIGRTLGEGNFGKVKHARHVETGEGFAVKILDRKRILKLKVEDQIKREIGTLKLLRHPNVVRLHEVLASKTKIYMVLEYVNGGELFDKIELKGRIPECEGRKLFQQLIDAISYCHEKGVSHRDLKPENILIDRKGNIKISDFGLSSMPQDLKNDGLLHTTCGSPNYIAPEIFKGQTQIPKWLSPGAQNLIQRILDPNPKTRINVDGIRADVWFSQHYTPIVPYDDEDINIDDITCSIKESTEADDKQKIPALINAFQLIGMSSYLDLSGFFEKEDVSGRTIRFTSNYSLCDLFKRIENIAIEMGFQVQKGHGKLKVIQQNNGGTSPKSPGTLSVAAEVFELSPSLYVVELRKSYGDSSLYRELCTKVSEGLGVCKQLLGTRPIMAEANVFKGDIPVVL